MLLMSACECTSSLVQLNKGAEGNSKKDKMYV